MENGNDVKNSEIKSQSSTEVPVKTVPAGSSVIAANTFTKTAHNVCVQTWCVVCILFMITMPSVPYTMILIE